LIKCEINGKEIQPQIQVKITYSFIDISKLLKQNNSISELLFDIFSCFPTFPSKGLTLSFKYPLLFLHSLRYFSNKLKSITLEQKNISLILNFPSQNENYFSTTVRYFDFLNSVKLIF
jgi:hypothetical protein